MVLEGGRVSVGGVTPPTFPFFPFRWPPSPQPPAPAQNYIFQWMIIVMVMVETMVILMWLIIVKWFKDSALGFVALQVWWLSARWRCLRAFGPVGCWG